MTGITSKPYSDPARNGTPLDRRVHQKGGGLDWDLIRHNYMQNAGDEEKEWQQASLDGNRNTKGDPKPVNTTLQRTNQTNRLTGDDKEAILRYNSVGMNVNWIAGEVGFSRSTVREFLRREGKLTAEETDEVEDGDDE